MRSNSISDFASKPLEIVKTDWQIHHARPESISISIKDLEEY